ncbi:MAG: hypothetical protein AAF502_25135 [Bacteroidota bacterium]
MDVSPQNEFQEKGSTALRALIEAIPYVGGSINTMIDHRNRVKQKRLNHFVELLRQYFEGQKEDRIKLHVLDTEEFGDLFESVISRVVKTKSEEKLNRFKNILVNQLSESQKFDFSETYLDLVFFLSDKQIEILILHAMIPEKVSSYYEEIPNLRNEIETLNGVLFKEKQLKENGKANDYDLIQKSIHRKKKVLSKKINRTEEVKKARSPETYQIEETEYNILVQDLVGKSLLMDLGASLERVNPFEVLAITDFGLDFLNFVQVN